MVALIPKKNLANGQNLKLLEGFVPLSKIS
jgi:hypothetical protein